MPFVDPKSPVKSPVTPWEQVAAIFNGKEDVDIPEGDGCPFSETVADFAAATDLILPQPEDVLPVRTFRHFTRFSLLCCLSAWSLAKHTFRHQLSGSAL